MANFRPLGLLIFWGKSLIIYFTTYEIYYYIFQFANLKKSINSNFGTIYRDIKLIVDQQLKQIFIILNSFIKRENISNDYIPFITSSIGHAVQMSSTPRKNQIKSLGSSYSDHQNKENQSLKKKLNINDRFILSSLIPVGVFYKAYRGIDMTLRKYVTVYIKPMSKQKLFSKNIKEELREKIAPPLIWTGTEKIDKNLFDIEVHAKYGPSLFEVLTNYKKKISERTLYLLAYQLLKLIDRIDNAGYVHRSINMKNVILSEHPSKNQLYFLNIFDLERQNEESLMNYDIKYCSISTHLKLKTCSKDTLESMCYMLMDFYTRGTLMKDLSYQKQKVVLQRKSTLKPEGIPICFLQFFQYVRNLNHNEQIKFTEWKIKFKKLVPEEQTKQYEWINNKGKTSDRSQIASNGNQVLNLFLGSVFSKDKNNDKYQSNLQLSGPEVLEELEENLCEGDIEEGQTDLKMEMGSKFMQANFLSKRPQ